MLGAAGRMGQSIIRCSEQAEGLEVSVAIEHDGHRDIGKPVPVGRDLIYSNRLQELDRADVAIDFSIHSAVPEHVAAVVARKRAYVLGTTGLTDEEGDVVRQAAKSIPIMWAPNMSLGVNLLLVMVEQASRILGFDYDPEITEMHHRHKKDAPSGTALGFAERVAAGREQILGDVAVHGRRGITGARTKEEIGIHSLRGGDIVGDHTVMFSNEGERIEFTHRATNRDTFAMGALRAAKWLVGREPGLYGMKDVLGL